MSGPWHPDGRARVNSRKPEAHGICQRCGFRYLRKDLVPQYEWQGMQLQNLNVYVCRQFCYDKPQIQLKTIFLPPDPVAIPLSFPEPYNSEVPSYTETVAGVQITQVNGTEMNTMIQVTPTPDPNNSYLVPPDF